MYDVEEAWIPAPPLPGEVVVAGDADEALDRVAEDLVTHAENCVRLFGDFHLALTGGADIARLYRRLMYDPQYRLLPWRRTHLWLVDEGPGGPDDEASAFSVVRDFICDHADIPLEQVHPIPADRATADEDYERDLRETLAWREKGQDRLDYVLLVLGEGASIAGLHPGQWLDEHSGRFVARVMDEAHDRVSMLPGLINAARFVAVVASGPERAPDVRTAADDETAPVRRIAPVQGELRWYVDQDACRLFAEE